MTADIVNLDAWRRGERGHAEAAHDAPRLVRLGNGFVLYYIDGTCSLHLSEAKAKRFVANLLKRAEISPDEAAWFRSKLDDQRARVS